MNQSPEVLTVFRGLSRSEFNFHSTNLFNVSVVIRDGEATRYDMVDGQPETIFGHSEVRNEGACPECDDRWFSKFEVSGECSGGARVVSRLSESLHPDRSPRTIQGKSLVAILPSCEDPVPSRASGSLWPTGVSPAVSDCVAVPTYQHCLDRSVSCCSMILR